jgi:hypothetical protein
MKRKKIRISILTLFLGMAFVACEKESPTMALENSNELEMDQNRAGDPAESIIIDLETTGEEEVDEIIFTIIDELEVDAVLQIEPDLENNTLILTVDPDPAHRVIHFSCSEGTLNACNSAALSFLNAGCSLQAYQSGNMYHYFADC